jgi:hypothetical protein
MVQTQIITKGQADARGISLDLLCKMYTIDGYKIVSASSERIELQRYVCPRQLR